VAKVNEILKSTFRWRWYAGKGGKWQLSVASVAARFAFIHWPLQMVARIFNRTYEALFQCHRALIKDPRTHTLTHSHTHTSLSCRRGNVQLK